MLFNFCVAEATEDRAHSVHDRVVHVRLQPNVALVVRVEDMGRVSL